MRVAALVSLFSNRNYTIFTLGNVLSMIGNWVQIVTMTWLTWELTHSTLWLGIISAAQIAPVFIVTPWAGVLADRVERVKLIFRSQAVACVIAVALYVLYELDLMTIGVIFASKALLAACVAVNQPARMAIMQDLVRKEDFPSSIAFGAVTFNVARFVGPAIAGLIIALGDIGMAFLLNAISFFALLVAVKMVKVGKRDVATTRARQSTLHDAWEGLRYASTHAGIVTIMGLYLIHALAVGPIIQLLAAYSDVAFGQGPEGLAILTSASGLGSILGGMWMTRPNSISDLTNVVCAAGFLAVLVVVVFVSLSSLTIAMVVICFYSSMTVAFRVASQTLVQLSVADAMRGRVMGLWAMLNRGGPSLGAILMGVLTDAYGLKVPFYVAAALMTTIMLAIIGRRHSLSSALAEERSPQSA